MKNHECQICAAKFTAKKGLLSNHGYKRPGDGFLHGSCFGSNRVDFATGTDALVEYRAVIAKMHADAVAFAAKLEGIPAFQLFTRESVLDQHNRPVYVGRTRITHLVASSFAPGVSSTYYYDRALTQERRRRAFEVQGLAGELARVDARIAAFVAPSVAA